MSLPDGPTAVLSTILVAGLAVGLGFGAYAILSEGDGGSGPAPASTDVALGGDFCVLMEEMTDYLDDMGEAMAAGDILSGNGDASETEEIDAFHELGRVIVDSTGRISDYLRRGAEMVTDPDVVAAFLQLADSEEELGTVWGAQFAEVESAEDVRAALAFVDSPEFSAIVSQGDAVAPIVSAYVLETCGIDLSGEGSAMETALKQDVHTLGIEIAIYFVYWDGVTCPEVTAADGEYFLNGEFIGGQSEGVVLTDQFSLDATSWCIEGSAEDDPEMVYSFSATEGLQPETCESLRP